LLVIVQKNSKEVIAVTGRAVLLGKMAGVSWLWGWVTWLIWRLETGFETFGCMRRGNFLSSWGQLWACWRLFSPTSVDLNTSQTSTHITPTPTCTVSVTLRGPAFGPPHLKQSGASAMYV
jgi:hypothetical protein